MKKDDQEMLFLKITLVLLGVGGFLFYAVLARFVWVAGTWITNQ